jgi:hypothetical protein
MDTSYQSSKSGGNEKLAEFSTSQGRRKFRINPSVWIVK